MDNAHEQHTRQGTVGGVYPKNSDDSPNTREREFLVRSSTQLEYRETVILSADCTTSKKSECVYTCPRAPFYREMKGLLHTDNTPTIREYS
jgi:Fe-S-cluster-containing dehydrogenase component